MNLLATSLTMGVASASPLARPVWRPSQHASPCSRTVSSHATSPCFLDAVSMNHPATVSSIDNHTCLTHMIRQQRGSRVVTSATSTSGATKTGRGRGRPRKVDTEDVARGVAADVSPDVLEMGAPELPRPAPHQQTLIRSFTLGGIGLHTGEYAFCRVRPAFAGEGRYFVLVNEGTNAGRFTLEQPKQIEMEQVMENRIETVDTQVEEAKSELFKMYLKEQLDYGYQGSFMDWLEANENTEILKAVQAGESPREEWDYDNPEPPLPFMERVGEVAVLAAMSSVHTNNAYALDLVSEDRTLQFMSVELLLAALEACGVDNARIELEGGAEVALDDERRAWRVEVPILDGSALGWTLECQFAGVRPAPPRPTSAEESEAAAAAADAADEAALAAAEMEEDEEEDFEEQLAVAAAAPAPKPVVPNSMRDLTNVPLTPKEARMVYEPVTVQDGQGGFITLYPDMLPRLTVGIDHSFDAFVIGKQWFSWCPFEDVHFRFELSPARGFVARRELLLQMREEGMVQGGSDAVLMVGFDSRWYDPELVRFVKDEPVRHMMTKLMGFLSLAAKPGGQGLPVGHISVYRPTTQLILDFLHVLVRDYSDEALWISPEEVDEGQVDEWCAEREEEVAEMVDHFRGLAPLTPKGIDPADVNGEPLSPVSSPLRADLRVQEVEEDLQEEFGLSNKEMRQATELLKMAADEGEDVDDDGYLAYDEEDGMYGPVEEGEGGEEEEGEMEEAEEEEQGDAGAPR